MREIRIPAFAKINLRLHILGKRPDGYHELRTIFQTISLHDELRLRPARHPGISLHILGSQSLSREPVRKNLVYAAAAWAAVPAMPPPRCVVICASSIASFPIIA